MEKDRVPSGCLIVKKKGDEISNGGTSVEVKVYESKKKKRHRWEPSDSETSEDLLTSRRSRDRDASVVVNRNSSDYVRTREETEIDSKRIREDGKLCWNEFIEAGSGRKRTGMDVFEYNDDYNEIVEKGAKKARLDVRVTRSLGSKSLKSSEKQREFETECRRSLVVEKGNGGGNKKRFEMTEDGRFRPVATPTENSGFSSSESIRVQGKNGVLKVMLNNKKKVGESEKTYGFREAEEARKGARSADTSNWKAPQSPPFYPEKKFHGKSCLREKNKVNSRKIPSTRKNEVSDWKSETIGISLPLSSKDVGSCSSKKEVRSKGERTSTSKKDGKVNRSRATEKQLIREKIRTMLVNAGWTIDFRQRMSKDYQDAVYINPSGREYWSVVKAYDAFKKECEGEGSNSFTPIPEEEISQLTRLTKKKIEREMKMLKKNSKNKHVTENLRSTINGKGSTSLMQDGKSVKVRMKEKAMKKPVRSSKKGVNPDDDGFILYSGKRTVLSWLIDMGTVPLNGKVQYMNRRGTQAMLEGRISRDGIHCGCCSKILTVSKFEIHAGSKLRQPFQNIFVESGVSLFQCQLDAWNKQEESDRSGFHSIDVNGDDPNDDTCGICGDGGDLICCDGCPSTFHQSCLDIQMLPPGDWHCPNCSCKFCGLVGGSTGDDTVVSALLTCSLCQEKYHNSCGQETDSRPVKSNNSYNSFCGQKCRKLFKQLQKLLGVKQELEAGFSWSLVQRSDLDSNASSRGLAQKAEGNSKLAVALTVMDECFLPIVDQRSRINLIHNVIYNCGSNFNRLNYSGFYTAILERGDEIISAATIRIHGTRLAEMPFIGTRHIYRRQGMCSRLLYAIESALCSLNVERLIIPAISELTNTWTVVFGFKPLEGLHKQEMRSLNMLVFPGTGLLQKLLLKQNLTEENVTEGSVVSVVVKTIELKNSHQSMSEVTNKSDIGSTVEPDVCASDKVVIDHAHEVNDVVADIETVTEASGDLANDASDVNNQVDVAHGPVLHAPGEESAPDTEFLSSGVTHHNKLEVEDRHISFSLVKTKLRSSTEDSVCDTHVINVRIAGIEPDLHSLAETTVEHTTSVFPNTVLSIDGSPVQSNSDLDHHTPEVECKSVDACNGVSAASHCEETFLCASVEGTGHEAFKVKSEDALEVITEVVVVEPKPHASVGSAVHHCTDTITQPPGAAFVECFQVSSQNIECHDSIGSSPSMVTVSDVNS
ncbi:zinc finger protein [Macleaya cordata]|uniref:Zinc finger protein n=1 Tax=Macleaya cordata TaxID=56857 RepID=A0A200Q4P6_MACCD|nr:zinc finger protein [Macleaya cordata]